MVAVAVVDIAAANFFMSEFVEGMAFAIPSPFLT